MGMPVLEVRATQCEKGARSSANFSIVRTNKLAEATKDVVPGGQGRLMSEDREGLNQQIVRNVFLFPATILKLKFISSNIELKHFKYKLISNRCHNFGSPHVN